MPNTLLKLHKSILFITVFFYTSLTSFEQDKVGTIDLTSDEFTEFAVFGDTLDDFSVYFTGENHTFATFNTKFQFKFLKYLNQTQNVKHFIFEQSPGLSYIINKIVIDDKTTHLHYLRDMFFGPFYELIKNIKTYNDSLPHDDKIQVHGIDIERFPAFSLYALNEMVDTIDKRMIGGHVFEQIKALASSNYKKAGASTYYSVEDNNFAFQFGQVSAWSSLSSIIDGAYEHQSTLSKALGADSSSFYSIIESLKIGQEWYMTEKVGDVKSPIIRERFMAEEFERIYSKDSESKYYGQFGRCHLHKDENAKHCYDYYMNSIANRINEINPSLKNQVLVIPIFYTRSRDMDKDVIESLNLKEQFKSNEDSYIIDLSYKMGNNPIVGFYDNLPFVIISNAHADEDNYYAYDFDNTIEEIHIGAWAGYTYFRKLGNLNTVLSGIDALPFATNMTHYTFSIDYFTIGETGQSFNFIYYPQMSNGDRFELGGFNATIGGCYPIGKKYFLTGLGFDMGYGQMKLKETVLSDDPNLIQVDNQNTVVYRNDIFTLDPNLQFRLTLPIISLNVKAGYAFDVSGKYWRLDGKAKEFTKTSFTSPYVQVGASFNFKSIK
ncbi:hypothetical protein N8987_00535 [Crocinitomix sp.]|nr:hypothetical protein [Crocinitomix sp.]